MSLPRESVDPAAIPPAALDICRRLHERGHGAWIVGGCVRDHLLGRPVSDWDVCTTARPEELLKSFPKAIPTGIAHGTVTVVRDHAHYEVTTLRGEGAYSDGRRPDAVHFLDDVTDDLARRDFTVNAIAFDPISRTLVDPFDGRKDIARRHLRAVGDPLRRFTEDGLRVLRAARFVATLEFELDPETERAINPSLHVFRKVSAERVRDEWMKAMKAATPSRAFEVMRRTGILAVTFPELAATAGCAQGPEHAWDVWTHSLATLDAVEGPAIVRVAALLHDVGKGSTAPGFAGHDAKGADLADRWLRQYRFSNDERALVTHLLRHHLLPETAATDDPALRRWLRRVGVDHLDALFALARADVTARGREVAAALADVDALQQRVAAMCDAGVALSTRDLAVDGATLMRELGIPPSRRLGALLDALLERVTDDPSLNEREALLTAARDLAPQG